MTLEIDYEHIARPFHPSTNLPDHLNTRHGVATEGIDATTLVDWHRQQHLDTNSQLDDDTDDRVPTDPAFRRRHKATPDDDTPTPPRLGATVLYRSRTGTYTMPALISAITASLYQPNVDAGHVPPLTSDLHVHLGVITCGIPGEVSDRTASSNPELTDPDRPNVPAGGTYAEWDIPFWDPATATGDGQLDAWLDGDLTAQPAGTWTWPVDA